MFWIFYKGIVLSFVFQYFLSHLCNAQALQNFKDTQWHPTPVLLPRKSHGQRSLVGFSSWVAKSWTRLSDFTFTFHFHALEKEMATHSSGLAWRIPGTGEPGGLPSMGSHRVGHNWSDLAAAPTVFFNLKLIILRNNFNVVSSGQIINRWKEKNLENIKLLHLNKQGNL